MDGLYNVGAYIRLSVENTAYNYQESESIENQREMLSKFITMMPGWVEHKFYIDNGFSGATFDRPAFQEMMGDVRGGRVNLVLVKDLSRFGRNYLEAGRYLEEELPSLGCRFVALSDGIDTENGENDILPFLNAMNDYYLKNLSDRIRSVMAAKARDGQKIAGNAPYGFWRDPNDHTRLIMDDYAADVVRRIYEMRKQGSGYPSIVKMLNSEGVLPPKLYYLSKVGKDISHIRTRSWIVTTVSMILRKEIYIGTAEQLVTTVVSHRNKREVKRPVDERVRIDNAFPAIIDRETWEAVQEVNRRAAEQCAGRAKPQKSLFSGLLVCADCGVTMTYWNPTKTYNSGKRIGYANYLCRTFHATARTSCSQHTIYEKVLIEIVLGHIRQFAEQITLDENAMLESLKWKLTSSGSSKADTKKERKFLRQGLHKLEVDASKLYEDRVCGGLSEEAFTDAIHKYEAERQEMEQRLSLLEQTEEETAAKVADIQLWIRSIRKYAAADHVDREMLESLVEKIEIGERCAGPDGQDRQDVRICYRFVGTL